MSETYVLEETNEDALSDRLKYSVLYDYYGELLSDHNKEIFEGYVLDDYSLGELAGSMEISRQGIRDSVNRTKKQLLMYEEKLHMVEKSKKFETGLADIKAKIDLIICEDKDKKTQNSLRSVCESIEAMTQLL